MSTDGTGLTFFQKSETVCPICDAHFHREEMRTGRGRMIAGDLSRELRRNYEPSKKHGEVYPIIYSVTVCPECLFAALGADFLNVSPKAFDAIDETAADRIKVINRLFPALDFTEPRSLPEGLAGYICALWSYDHFTNDQSPIIKQGICALRAAWLCYDLHKKSPNDNYDHMMITFYRKARFYYALAVENEQTGKQGIGGCPNLGPDLDKNYMYDGVLYLAGYLEHRFGPRQDAERRHEALVRSKRTVARIFGMGRASKNKPAAILEYARQLYDAIAEDLGQVDADPEQDAQEA